MITLTTKLLRYVIILGLISLMFTWAFNVDNQLLTYQEINGIGLRTININNYLQNLSNAWETNALDFKSILPDKQFQVITENILQGEFWAKLGNNLALMFDYLYLPINFLLYILRWLSWVIRILFCIIGYPINGNITNTLSWITQNLIIPYL